MSNQKNKNNSGASEFFVSVLLPILGYICYFAGFKIAAAIEIIIGITILYWAKSKHPIEFQSIFAKNLKDTDFPWLSAVIPGVISISICLFTGEKLLSSIGVGVCIFFLLLFGAYEGWTKWVTVLIAAPIALPLELFWKKSNSALVKEIQKIDLMKGNNTDGWDISPGLESHPITLLCSENAAKGILDSLTANTDAFRNIFTSEKIRWRELENFLENYHQHNKEIDEIEHLDTFDAELLYSGDATETAKLLKYYFDSIKSGYTQFKFIKDMESEMRARCDDDIDNWECRVDAANDMETCSKCRALSKKKFSLNMSPLPPFHFGCRCSIQAVQKKQKTKRKT